MLEIKNKIQSELIQKQLKIFDELAEIENEILKLKLRKEELKQQQANINNKLVMV